MSRIFSRIWLTGIFMGIPLLMLCSIPVELSAAIFGVVILYGITLWAAKNCA